MARYCGKVGYRTTSETEPGIWEETIVERKYFGDVTRNYSKNGYDAQFVTTNHTPSLNNSISVLADPYAWQNFQNIVYAEYMGTKWVVSNVDASQYPRLVLALGGVYNDEQQTDSSSEID